MIVYNNDICFFYSALPIDLAADICAQIYNSSYHPDFSYFPLTACFKVYLIPAVVKPTFALYNCPPQNQTAASHIC